MTTPDTSLRYLDPELLPAHARNNSGINVWGEGYGFQRLCSGIYHEILKVEERNLIGNYEIRRHHLAEAPEGINISHIVRLRGLGREIALVAHVEPEELDRTVADIIHAAEGMRRADFILAFFAECDTPDDADAFDHYCRRKHGRSGSFFGSFLAGAAACVSQSAFMSDDDSGPKIQSYAYREYQAAPLTEAAIKETMNNVPERISATYLKKNPEAARILRQTLELYGMGDAASMLFEVASSDRNFFKKIFRQRCEIASRWKLDLRKWDSSCSSDFTSSYLYCLYLIDNRGKEIPLRFTHQPSYCLFVMHLLDRKQRGDNVRALDFQKNADEFSRLYATLFMKENGKIKELCERTIQRSDATTGRLRGGRLTDYIKDISDTLDKIMGRPDSLPLKVGNGHFIEIQPERISIDASLPKFKFS